LLLEHKADPNDFEQGFGYPIMVDAVRRPAVVKLLIEHGANLRRRITWQGVQQGPRSIGDEASVLHFAVEGGNLECVRLLIAAGVDPNASDDQGQTPLHIAIMSSALEAVNQKIMAVFAQNAADAQGQPRLRIAEKSAFPHIIECLVENDASLRFTDRSGRDALKLAEAIKAPKEICEYLSRKRGEIDARYLRAMFRHR
jgi:ankyrin repeat protein